MFWRFFLRSCNSTSAARTRNSPRPSTNNNSQHQRPQYGTPRDRNTTTDISLWSSNHLYSINQLNPIWSLSTFNDTFKLMNPEANVARKYTTTHTHTICIGVSVSYSIPSACAVNIYSNVVQCHVALEVVWMWYYKWNSYRIVLFA